MANQPVRRSAEEVRRLLESFQRSGLTRRQFCEREGIPRSTLDCYRHRAKAKPATRLARVAVAAPPKPPCEHFTLVLANGRRIESGWNFDQSDLARLIRTAEAV
jgi:hypothetical protein